MTIKTATPYLILNGKVPQAIALYEKALGAKTESLQRFGDMDQSCPEARKDLVMHSVLKIGGATIMMSDGPGEGPITGGANLSIALDIDDVAEGRKAFDALAATGKIETPLFEAPWGALFGVVTDAYHVSWMFNVATGPK